MELKQHLNFFVNLGGLLFDFVKKFDAVNGVNRVGDSYGFFCLVALKINNWNNDLSPWSAPAVFGKENFGGNADAALKEVLSLCTDRSKAYYIGGYSLAGLFALWAAYQTDIFEGVAAASPSIWFPGFVDYMEKSDLKASKVYLSLGDKEEKVRNLLKKFAGIEQEKVKRIIPTTQFGYTKVTHS